MSDHNPPCTNPAHLVLDHTDADAVVMFTRVPGTQVAAVSHAIRRGTRTDLANVLRNIANELDVMVLRDELRSGDQL